MEWAGENKSSTAVWERPAIMFPEVEHEWDVILGFQFLRQFRVTIDYPRQKILLEPYDDSTVKVFDKDDVVTIKRPDGTVITIPVSKGNTLYHYADGTIEISP